MAKNIKNTIASIALLWCGISYASDCLNVSDFSQIKWQLRSTDGRVHLRNLDSFDPSYLGCCYNYHIDTSTEPGKAIWSAFLAKEMASQGGTLCIADKQTANSPINFIGDW